MKDSYELPDSNLGPLYDIRNPDNCTSVKEMVRSKLARLIGYITIKEINPSKSSYYKKFIEKELNVSEAVSLLKIVSRFLVDQTDIKVQFPADYENVLNTALKRLETLGYEDQLEILCLEIIYTLIQDIDDEKLIDETLSKYGMCSFTLGEHKTLIQTNKSGNHRCYLGNGRIAATVDFGTDNNILLIDNIPHRRDTGEKIENVEVLHNSDGDVFLMHWDKTLNKGIIYQWNTESQSFENMGGYRGEPIFITAYSPNTGFDTNHEQVILH